MTIAALSAYAVTGCSPQAFSLNMEMRYPSRAGQEFGGKSMAVVYADVPEHEGRDSVFNEYLANGFAQSLENDYFGGEQAIPLYRITKNPDGNYSDKDTLRNLVLDTNQDVVFLFDAPEFGTMQLVSSGSDDTYTLKVPVSVRLYLYNSLGQDSVYVYKGSRNLKKDVILASGLTEAEAETQSFRQLSAEGEALGKASSGSFLPTWKEESYTVIYYDNSEKWDNASQAASEFRWKDAMEAWMDLLDTGNLTKRSSLEYNIALACYMLSDYELALKWLDKSDKDYPISLSKTLRSRIKTRQSLTE